MNLEKMYKVVLLFSGNTTAILGWYKRYKEAEESLQLYLEFPYHDDVVFVAIAKDGFLYRIERVNYTG